MRKPFFVLAPMDDVTDTVFRRIVSDLAPPDFTMTEFVNVDGLMSPGRAKLMPRLDTRLDTVPVIAQIWGKNPDNFYEIAKQIADGTIPGFSGIDINFGCPDKNVVRNGTCSAFILPENRDKAVEIIEAVKAGAAGKMPVSVKTRLGFGEVDFSWHELILQQDISMLTIHGRTKKQMSKVPADWEKIAEVRAMRDKLAPNTLIVGNGDVKNRAAGLKLAKKYNLDGVMIGRGIFDDPFAFADPSPWPGYTRQQRIELLKKHVSLFAETWQNQERRFDTLKKFAKIYINGFDGAKELREKFMNTRSVDELLEDLS